MYNKIKIFVTYHNYDFPVFKTDVFQPIMGGNQGKPLKDGFIGDDTGDNISNLNKSHAELTTHYWLLHNYLPSAKEEYIGLCTYRRFLDFADTKYEFIDRKESNYSPLNIIFSGYFQKLIFEKYTETNILKKINGYDIVTPQKWNFRNNNRLEYDYFHQGSVLTLALDILNKKFPEYTPYAKDFFDDHKGYYCLCFVMKKELMKAFLEWQFKIVEELKENNVWDKYDEDRYIRTPAFIMERFYNIWLRYQIDKHKIKILELPAYMLEFEISTKNKVKYIKALDANGKTIEAGDMDEKAAIHPVLNKIIKSLVNQKKYHKLLGDPKSFFFDSRSIMIRLIGVFYK